MSKISLVPIGYVENEFNEPVGHHELKMKPSKIILDKQYTPALLNIEQSTYIDIVFHFHQSKAYKLVGTIHNGEERGVFASRSPNRPNGIGVTTVKLIEIKDNMLWVEGLDAINNTPVLDIKCTDTSWVELESISNAVHNEYLKNNPRSEIQNLVKQENTEGLLLKSGALHGHYCPGLAMGVMAATRALNILNAQSDGMEDVLAITETNNCFADGVQFVTGCSFGNNALIYRDLGKTAFTLTRRDGRGIRISSRRESQDIIKQEFSNFQDLYTRVVSEQNHDPHLVSQYKKAALERAFGTLKIPFEMLFNTQQVEADVPDYASIRDSVVCQNCGESLMKTRSVKKDGEYFCYTCSASKHNFLDGNGIHV